MDEISEVSCTPPEIAEIAKSVALNLLPEKSRDKYEIQYEQIANGAIQKEPKIYRKIFYLRILPRKPR